MYQDLPETRDTKGNTAFCASVMLRQNQTGTGQLL